MKIERYEKGVKRGTPFFIKVNGEQVVAYPGETVAGAMLAAGKKVFGTSCLKNSPRGVYCGIGVCYSCVLTINNIPSQRACQTLAKEKMVIESEVAAKENP
jgi:hypothetical protein